MQRPTRTILLILVVAMASMLIAAVGVATGSLTHAVESRVEATLGTADLRLRPAGKNATIDAAILDTVRTWPEVQRAAPRLQASASLRFVRPVWSQQTDGRFLRDSATFIASGPIAGMPLDPALHTRPVRVVAGRLPQADDEIVIDTLWVDRLSRRSETPQIGEAGLALFARRGSGEIMKADPGPTLAQDAQEAQRLNDAGVPAVGDTVELVWFQKPPRALRIVGIAPAPPLGGSPQGYMTVEGLASVTDQPARLSEIDIVLRPGTDANAVVAARKETLPRGTMLQTTERITSGITQNTNSSRLGFLVASIMTFFGGAFIIMTGLSTSVTERHRELGILRAIGATPGQLAGAQLATGLIIGLAGAAVGVPLGAAAAWLLIDHFQDRLNSPPILPPDRLAIAVAGAAFCGVIGALWPAWQASRTTPLRALAVRAQPPRPRTIAILTAVGILGILTHLAIFTLIPSGQAMFWSYFTFGLPLFMIAYFVLGVPMMLVLARVAGPLIERALGLPPKLLRRSIAATPYRFGFTAGALMAGLALMVAIWTQGRAVLEDWIDKIEFPDAFVYGPNLGPDAQRLVDELPFVTSSATVTIQPVQTDLFGVRGMTTFSTNFIAFDPTPFFKMTRLNWVQGDPATAERRLNEGGAVIVAREFLTARGLGVGHTFTCEHNGATHEFEIVGVVTSPGLEMVGNMFDVGDGFVEHAVHAVFGSRKDLLEKFNNDAIMMIQMTLDPQIDDQEALGQIRAALINTGILAAGSGREIKQQIQGFIGTALFISSAVAVFAMAVACLGVANLIIAGIQSRRFEFGVLRAVGGPRHLLTRLVLAEALLIALAAAILGTAMGIQGAFGGTQLDRFMWGIDASINPPVGPIAVGWVALFLLTTCSAIPAVLALLRLHPRELLASVRG